MFKCFDIIFIVESRKEEFEKVYFIRSLGDKILYRVFKEG